MILVDTTVLVYAVGNDKVLASAANELLENVADARVAATTTPEVIQEFVHVRSRRGFRADACDLAKAFIDLLSPLTVCDEASLTIGLKLFGRYPRLDSFDAVLAGVAIASELTLVSADKGFGGVTGLDLRPLLG